MARRFNWFGKRPNDKTAEGAIANEGRKEPVVEGAEEIAEPDGSQDGAQAGALADAQTETPKDRPAEARIDEPPEAPEDSQTDATDPAAAREAETLEQEREEAERLAAARALEEALAAQAAPPHIDARPVETDEDEIGRYGAGVAPPAGLPATVEHDDAPLAGFVGDGAGAPPPALPPATEADGDDVLPPPGNGGTTAPAQKPGLLSILFRSAATMAVSIGTSIAFKAALAASIAAPSPLLVVGGTVLAVTAAGFAYRRVMDIIDYNRANKDAPENKASLLRDFFKPSATGHTVAKYTNAASASILISTAGGLIGFTFSEEIKEGLGTVYERVSDLFKPETVIDAPPPADIPVPDASDAGTSGTEAPVADAPKPEISLSPDEPIPGAGLPEILPDVAPDAILADPAVTPEQPAGDAVPAEPPPAEAPASELTALEQARAALPETPDAVLAETLARLESASAAVRDQAIKDIGYFFANGLHGVTENDQLANALFESVIHNAQAAHDLGYQLLHGIGGNVDLQRAFDLLTYANENGSTLAAEKLDYMQRMGMAPA